MTGNTSAPGPDPLFAGTGYFRELCRTIDWSAAGAGPVEAWPESLRAAVRLVLESRMTMALWIGPDYVLLHNEGYAPVLGHKFPHAFGRPAREVWAEVWPALGREFDRVRGGAATHHEDALFKILRNGRDEDAYFNYSLTPLRDEAGRVVALFNVLEETTRVVRERAEQEEFLDFALNTAAIGAWDLNLESHGARRSRMHDRIFGYPDLLPAWTYEVFIEHVLPEDRPAVEASFRQAVATGGNWSFECRIRRTDGEVRWIWAAGRHRADPSRRRHMAGIVQDITERRRAEAALRESEEKYRTLFESIDEGFCIIEVLFEGARAVDYRFLQVNPAFEKHTGLAGITGRRVREVLPTHEDHWMEAYGQVALTGEAVRFSDQAAAVGRYYDVYAFRIGRPEQRRVAVLFNDITERTNFVRALEENDRRKSEFLAMLSHELRNPLTPIKNGLEILNRVAPGSDSARRAQDVIRRQVDQLAGLIDDLLDLTRITRGKIQLHRRPIELRDVLRHAVEDNAAFFERAAVEVRASTPPAPVPVEADWNRISQVFGNLLQNAAKFTSPGGTITVGLEIDEAAREADVRVADTGAGMTPEMLAHLFEPFRQGDTTLDRSKGGLGLGLALVKGLVQLHGGTVSAKSEGPGRGAEFTVRLPLSAAPGAAARDAARRGDPAHRRVLVIEDNVDAADTLREVFELDGHEVAVAYNGPSGIDKARAFHPEIVFCDIGLPGMDGYDVARAFRADPALRDLTLVALTGYALPEDQHKAAEAGFNRHMAKPPSLSALRTLIAQL